MRPPRYRPRATTGTANGAAPPTGCRHSGHVLCRATAVGRAEIERGRDESCARGPSAQGLRVAQYLERRAALADG
jgi:hypothetical protein